MDLGFGAHDTLSQRGRNREESVRNLLGRQTAHLPQRQCHASFRRQRWMTAGEDQPKPVVLDALVFKGRRLAGLDSELLRDSRLRRVEPGPPPHRVDGPEPARRDEPRAGIGGHALLWPSLEGSTEGIVQRVLGQLEVAEQADQGRKDPPRFRTIDGIHFFPHLFSGVLCHDDNTFPLWRRCFNCAWCRGRREWLTTTALE